MYEPRGPTKGPKPDAKGIVDIIVGKIGKPSGAPTEDEGGEDEALLSAADDLIDAMQAKDRKAVAEALRSAFTICDAEPHEEGPHEDEEEREE